MIAEPAYVHAYIDAKALAEINRVLAESHRMGISLVWHRGLWRHTFDHGWVEVDPESMHDAAGDL